jgi:hypothetical protein
MGPEAREAFRTRRHSNYWTISKNYGIRQPVPQGRGRAGCHLAQRHNIDSIPQNQRLCKYWPKNSGTVITASANLKYLIRAKLSHLFIAPRKIHLALEPITLNFPGGGWRITHVTLRIPTLAARQSEAQADEVNRAIC